MLKALYYPHTEIRSEVILKNALLLWDSIETIVPNVDWQRQGPTGDSEHWQAADAASARLFDEAAELIVRNVCQKNPNAGQPILSC
jgi:hypothetical protein